MVRAIMRTIATYVSLLGRLLGVALLLMLSGCEASAPGDEELAYLVKAHGIFGVWEIDGEVKDFKWDVEDMHLDVEAVKWHPEDETVEYTLCATKGQPPALPKGVANFIAKEMAKASAREPKTEEELIKEAKELPDPAKYLNQPDAKMEDRPEKEWTYTGRLQCFHKGIPGQWLFDPLKIETIKPVAREPRPYGTRPIIKPVEKRPAF